MAVRVGDTVRVGVRESETEWVRVRDCDTVDEPEGVKVRVGVRVRLGEPVYVGVGVAVRNRTGTEYAKVRGPPAPTLPRSLRIKLRESWVCCGARADTDKDKARSAALTLSMSPQNSMWLACVPVPTVKVSPSVGTVMKSDGTVRAMESCTSRDEPGSKRSTSSNTKCAPTTVSRPMYAWISCPYGSYSYVMFGLSLTAVTLM